VLRSRDAVRADLVVTYGPLHTVVVKNDGAWPVTLTLCGDVQCDTYNTATARPGVSLRLSTPVTFVSNAIGALIVQRTPTVEWCIYPPTLHLLGQPIGAILVSDIQRASFCSDLSGRIDKAPAVPRHKRHRVVVVTNSIGPQMGFSSQAGPPATKVTPTTVTRLCVAGPRDTAVLVPCGE
jgi:hypothetical protein